MKSRILSLLLLLISFSLSLRAAAQDTFSGYYVLSSARSESNAMYVGQLQAPIGFVGSDDFKNALQVCWRRNWSLPEKPDRETARYIFRIEPSATNPSTDATEAPSYTLQNLGYSRYVRHAAKLYHPCPTTTTIEDAYDIQPSDSIEGAYTLGSKNLHMEQKYLHASNDVNSVVMWIMDGPGSQWRLIPVGEDYAQEAYRIFNPLYESPKLNLNHGHICETPEAEPDAVVDSIVSLYNGEPVFVFVWKKHNSSAEYFEEMTQDFMAHSEGTFQVMREYGLKLVFITDETFPVYDWLEIAEATEGDHYRVPSIGNVDPWKKFDEGSVWALYNAEGHRCHFGRSNDFPAYINEILPYAEKIRKPHQADNEK